MTVNPTYDDVVATHFELVRLFQKEKDPIVPAGVRDENLLRSAVERPATSLGNTEKYRSLEAKAAALFHSLMMNHPFHNGNKRTALVATLRFLDRYDRRVVASDDDVFAFVIEVAAHTGAFSGPTDEVVGAIEAWLCGNLAGVRHMPSTMRTTDFLESCEKAGATYRKTGDGGSWLIRGPSGRSLRVHGSTNQLEGIVVKRYLQKLGLGETDAGISAGEFEAGVDPEQELMRRFRKVLKRLAHA
jgi:death-on-curing family protein